MGKRTLTEEQLLLLRAAVSVFALLAQIVNLAVTLYVTKRVSEFHQ